VRAARLALEEVTVSKSVSPNRKPVCGALKAAGAAPKSVGTSKQSPPLIMAATALLYAAKVAQVVPSRTARVLPPAERRSKSYMSNPTSGTTRGTGHTPAASRQPKTPRRKWRPAVQMPLPLPEPPQIAGGHEMTTRVDSSQEGAK
jgi:hypothetical protein